MKNKHYQPLYYKESIPTWKVFLVVALFISSLWSGNLLWEKMPHSSANTVSSNEKATALYQLKEQQLLETLQKEKWPSNQYTLQQKNPDAKQWLFLPKDATDMDATLQQALAALLKEQAQASSVSIQIGFIDTQNVTQHLTVYQPTVTTYTWQPEKVSWAEETQTARPLTRNTQTDAPLTFKELINEPSHLLAISQMMQQNLLNHATQKSEAVIQQVLTMPPLTFEETDFTYTNDGLTIFLPTEIAGQTTVHLSMQEIAPFIAAAFLDEPYQALTAAHTLDPTQKYIALTFDDGPSAQTTPQVLDILREKKVPATFFVLGQNVANNASLLQRMIYEGHEIGSHTYSHPLLTELDLPAVKQEIIQTDQAIYLATGKLPTLFRPPYGAINSAIAEVIGKPIIEWSIDPKDWQNKEPRTIIKNIKQAAYPNTILLLHDTQNQTLQALPEIIDALQAQGYTFVLVRELLQDQQKPLFSYFSSDNEKLTE